MLEPGTSLPEFSALDEEENPVRSTDWLGRWTVLWWYLKADTPG